MFLLDTATKLLFCKETLGKGPVVEDNRGVGASVETSDGAERAHLKTMKNLFLGQYVAISYLRPKILFQAIS